MAKVIEQSKQRINILLPGFVITGLVALAILLLGFGIIPDSKADIHPLAMVLFGVVLLSSAYFIYKAVCKLRDTSPGIVADDDGLTYNIGVVGKSIGTIRWEDIKAFKDNEDIFITVMVKNPEHYLKRIADTRLRNQIHTRACVEKPGALMLVSSYGLRCDYDELKSWLDNRLAEHTAAS